MTIGLQVLVLYTMEEYALFRIILIFHFLKFVEKSNINLGTIFWYTPSTYNSSTTSAWYGLEDPKKLFKFKSMFKAQDSFDEVKTLDTYLTDISKRPGYYLYEFGTKNCGVILQ